MRPSIRLLVLVALLVGALTAATAASAAKGEFQARELGRAHGKAPKLPASLERTLRAQGTVKRGSALLESAVVAPQLVAGEFEGFAYCGDDVAWIWPADAPNHDVTVTRTHAVFSATGDFSDAVVESSPFLLIQTGQDFIIYDLDSNMVVYGPTNFADAWIEFDLTGNTDSVLFVNEITTIDGGNVSGHEFAVVEALGPSETGAANVCQP